MLKDKPILQYSMLEPELYTVKPRKFEFRFLEIRSPLFEILGHIGFRERTYSP